MSRTIKTPLEIPKGVQIQLMTSEIQIRGPRGQLNLPLHYLVQCNLQDQVIWFIPMKAKDRRSVALSGTLKALCRNHLKGVVDGYTKRLQLVGVGYRAEAQGSALSMNLGFSQPVQYAIPEGITIQTPQATEIVVSGLDKYQVGQVAAEIRGFRKPEPYKGKGIRYFDERILIKETKKK